jgi:hypothetical protein
MRSRTSTARLRIGNPGLAPRLPKHFEVGLSTVHRVRQAFVEEGLEEALYRKKPSNRQYRKLDGAQEAKLLAIACSHRRTLIARKPLRRNTPPPACEVNQEHRSI